MEHPLRTHRTAAGLSVDALAQRVGVAKSTISRIENDAADPSISLVRKLCQALPGLSANDFMRSAAMETSS